MMAMLLVTLFFSAGVAVNSIPATVLVEPRETVCFSKFAKEETRFSLDVFVFQGDGIGVTVSYSTSNDNAMVNEETESVNYSSQSPILLTAKGPNVSKSPIGCDGLSSHLILF